MSCKDCGKLRSKLRSLEKKFYLLLQELSQKDMQITQLKNRERRLQEWDKAMDWLEKRREALLKEKIVPLKFKGRKGAFAALKKANNRALRLGREDPIITSVIGLTPRRKRKRSWS